MASSQFPFHRQPTALSPRASIPGVNWPRPGDHLSGFPRRCILPSIRVPRPRPGRDWVRFPHFPPCAPAAGRNWVRFAHCVSSWVERPRPTPSASGEIGFVLRATRRCRARGARYRSPRASVIASVAKQSQPRELALFSQRHNPSFSPLTSVHKRT
jgi:hypothetical protein